MTQACPRTDFKQFAPLGTSLGDSCLSPMSKAPTEFRATAYSAWKIIKSETQRNLFSLHPRYCLRSGSTRNIFFKTQGHLQTVFLTVTLYNRPPRFQAISTTRCIIRKLVPFSLVECPRIPCHSARVMENHQDRDTTSDTCIHARCSQNH